MVGYEPHSTRGLMTLPTQPDAMLGRQFGRLVVIAQAQTRNKSTWWLCRCECGTENEWSRSQLGRAKSCGCLAREKFGERVRARLKGVRARNWKGVGDISASFWGTVLDGARNRNLEVTVTLQDAWDLFLAQGRKCALTGWDLHFAPVGKRVGTASLDRIDSTQGYVPGNIQWLDKRVQQMKWDLPQSEFLLLCQAVAAYGSKTVAVAPI